MKLLISAASFQPLPDAVPTEIVYIPEGEHAIHPTVDGKPKEITVKVPPQRGAAIAASLQADLSRRLADNVRPIIDFDHKHRGPAAGIPASFRYEAGKGIVMALDWTRAGREAIEGKDFSYFSPEFLLNEDGTPGGLPSRGPLGTLCNNPAFRTIPRIAASDAAPTQEPKQPITPMSQFLILATCGLLNQSEAARDDAETLARQRVSAMRSDAETLRTVQASLTDVTAERDQLKTKLQAAETKLADGRKEQGESLFQRAVKAGLAAPKDEVKKAEYVQAAESENALAIKFMTERIEAAEANPTDPIERPIVRATGQDVPGATNVEARAKQLVAAG
ncbi:hypothetical protein JIN85_20295, partial [Luteolibacter pohnpeiensis]